MNNKIKTAFTLIELLVVIAIIGILSGLIIVGMNNSVQSATIAKSQVFSSSLRNSLLANLISEWKFDGTTADGGVAVAGDVLDTWTGSNNGTVSATPPTVRTSNCINESCLQFNGSSNYITIGDRDNLSFPNNIFTFSFWVNPNSTTSGLGIVGKRSPWEYSIHSYDGSSNINFYSWNSSGASGVYVGSCSIDLNKWNYFVWTGDGTNGWAYKNGTICYGPNGRGSTMSNTTSIFEIGRGGDASGFHYLSGLMDELRVFSASVASSFIEEQYCAGLNKLLAKGLITKSDYLKEIESLVNKVAEK